MTETPCSLRVVKGLSLDKVVRAVGSAAGTKKGEACAGAK